jgi:hypothetical protein
MAEQYDAAGGPLRVPLLIVRVGLMAEERSR